jgi:hypothetical protein
MMQWRGKREEKSCRTRNKALKSGVKGVMIIEYTMNRDARWRGLYGGYGEGKGKGMDGDERRGITSPLYLRKSHHVSMPCDLVKQQMVFLSQHEMEEGKRLTKNESAESKKERYRECRQGISLSKSISHQQLPKYCATRVVRGGA